MGRLLPLARFAVGINCFRLIIGVIGFLIDRHRLGNHLTNRFGRGVRMRMILVRHQFPLHRILKIEVGKLIRFSMIVRGRRGCR
jgi:hypothetical protein